MFSRQFQNQPKFLFLFLFLFLFQIENRKIPTMKKRKTILKSKKVIELLSLSED